MQGQVIKIHSDFYYVESNKHIIFTCKIRDILKKQKTDILVGDFVELSDDNNFIISRLERKNYILRPKAANIDIALVVVSFKEPDIDYIQLNRYLTYLKYFNIDTAICINKEDLENNFQQRSGEIEKIYTSLKYKVFFISAKNKLGISEIKEYIKNKTIVLCGPSGVGKTTLINSLNKNYQARTNEVSLKTSRGRHTTRHCEIVDCENYKIMDTPGFSCLNFDFLLPDKLLELFDDIKIFKKGCKYSNCMHDTKQKGICSIVDNLDKIEPMRYESYLEFLKESLKYKKDISQKSIKKEENIKNTGDKTFTKISKRKRNLSRKTQKQSVGDYDGTI